MSKLFVFAVIFNICLHSVTGTSPPYRPEEAKAQKAEYCKTLLELQPKLPQRVQQYYNYVQTNLCLDDTVQQHEIFTYIKDNLSKDDIVEVGVIQNGKENYCKFILGLSKLYRIDGSEPEEALNVTSPEYQQFKDTCSDSSKNVSSIIPLAQKLARIYHHF